MTDQPAMRIDTTTTAAVVAAMFDRVAAACGDGTVAALHIGSRVSIVDRSARTWGVELQKRFGERLTFTGLDIEPGENVHAVADICDEFATLDAALGGRRFDFIALPHVLEHVKKPWVAAENVQRLAKPGGHLFVSAPWVQAYHAFPRDYWRFSFEGLALLFDRLQVSEMYYSGAGLGTDVAYCIGIGGAPEISPRQGAVEGNFFQVVFERDDNQRLLAAQPSQKLPLSRGYLPAMIVNLFGRLRL